jgi:hypothetical protein
MATDQDICFFCDHAGRTRSGVCAECGEQPPPAWVAHYENAVARRLLRIASRPPSFSWIAGAGIGSLTLGVLCARPGAFFERAQSTLAGAAILLLLAMWSWLYLQFDHGRCRTRREQLGRSARWLSLMAIAFACIVAGVTLIPLGLRLRASERGLVELIASARSKSPTPTAVGLFQFREVFIRGDGEVFLVTDQDGWGMPRGLAYIASLDLEEHGNASLANVYGNWYEWISYH